MQNAFSIRPAEDRDVSQIANIAEATDLFPAELLPDMIAGFFTGEVADLWFVAELNHKPIGFGFCEPERMTVGTWNLLAIGVLPDHQGSGTGAAMLRYLEDRLLDQSARILLVETLGTQEFDLTRTFYSKNGFTEEARIRDFYDAGQDKIVYWKAL